MSQQPSSRDRAGMQTRQRGSPTHEARRVVVAELGQALASRNLAADRRARRLVKDRSVRVRAGRLGLVARPVGDRGELGVRIGEAVADQDRLERDRQARRGRLLLVVVVNDGSDVGQVRSGVGLCSRARRSVSELGERFLRADHAHLPPDTWKSTFWNLGNFS